MTIREAVKSEFDKVMKFYHDLIDSMRDSEFKPGWIKGVYPTERFIKTSINKNELFVGFVNDAIAGAMVLNRDCADGYENAKWRIDAKKNEFIVVHALGVSTACQGRGIAKQMVLHAVKNCAERDGVKTIRLDVLGTNLPAQKLYTSMGFSHVGTVKLYYENTGLTDFLLYEFIIG